MAAPVDISAIARVIDQASAPLRAIQGAIKNVGEAARAATGAMSNIGRLANFGGLRGAIGGVGAALGRVGGAFKSMLGGPLGKLFGVAGIAGIAGATKAMQDYITTTAQLGRASQRLGISVEGLQVFRNLVGNTELADGALNKLQKTLTVMAGGGKAAAKLAPLFAKMGISMAEIKAGNLDTILPKIAAGFEKNTNPTQRAAAALALFGKSGQAMIPYLARGPGALEQMRQKMQAFGQLLTADQVKQAQDTALALREIGWAGAGTGKQIMANLLPHLQPLITGFRDWLIEMQPSIITGVTEAARILGDILKTLWTGIETVVGWMGGWQNVAITLAAVFSAQLVPPIMGLVGAMTNLGFQAALAVPALAGIAGAATAGAVAIYRNWDKIAPWFATQLETITGVSAAEWKKVADGAIAAWGRIAKAFKTGGLAGGIVAAVQEIIGAWGQIWPFMETNFPRITQAAKDAWEGIQQGVTSALQNIKRAWETGGLGAALEVTWASMKTGALEAFNYVRDALRNIPWENIGTSAVELFASAWRAYTGLMNWGREKILAIPWTDIGNQAVNALVAAFQGVQRISAWFQGLDWYTVGYEAGQAIINAVKLAFDVLLKLDEWFRQVDWPTVVVEIAKGIIGAVDAIAAAGLAIVEGLVDAMIAATATQFRRWVVQMAESLPDWMKRLLGVNVAAVAQWAGQGQLQEIAQAVPLPERQPSPPPLVGAAPGAPAGPAVTPSLVAQAVQAIPVRLDGQIEQRLKVDMSPDLRAMLTEQRSEIAGLRVAQSVDIGRTMEPAAGVA